MPLWGNSFYNALKERLEDGMTLSVQKFIKLANFYNQMSLIMSAVCVQKGGIAMENYNGRYFAADALEYVAEYGRRLMQAANNNLAPEIISAINKFEQQYQSIKHLTTPSQKPIYEMTLAEFERVMNI